MRPRKTAEESRKLTDALEGEKEPVQELLCSLSEQERIDGQVKSRTLAYLGSIAPDAIERASARAEFWYQVTSNLDKLAQSSQLTEEELAKLTTAIAQKVEPVEVRI